MLSFLQHKMSKTAENAGFISQAWLARSLPLSMNCVATHYLSGERNTTMQLRDIMTTEVERIHENISLQEAAQKMRDFNVGLLPIYDGDRLVGMLSDRDIAVRATAEGRNPAQTAVREAMTQNIIYCFEDQSVEEAATMMADHQIRRLIILNRDKRLVGMVSLGDLATQAKSQSVAGEALSGVSQ
jgi:CBS domain-containing protein